MPLSFNLEDLYMWHCIMLLHYWTKSSAIIDYGNLCGNLFFFRCTDTQAIKLAKIRPLERKQQFCFNSKLVELQFDGVNFLKMQF